MVLRWLPVFALLAGCAQHVAGLEPRPRLPHLEHPAPTVLRLGEGIAQVAAVPGGPVLQTFRGDLERGFLNGFPGARPGERGVLHLGLSVAEPGLRCSSEGGCHATLRFKGQLIAEDLEGTGFSGTVKSDRCRDDAGCFQQAIERMYEQIFVAVKGQLGRMP
jgi:hypothetical protein